MKLSQTRTMSQAKHLLYMKFQLSYDLKIDDTVLVFRELRIHGQSRWYQIYIRKLLKFSQQNARGPTNSVPTSAFFFHHFRKCPLQRFIAECHSVWSQEMALVSRATPLRKKLAHSKPNSRNFDLLGSCLLT